MLTVLYISCIEEGDDSRTSALLGALADRGYRVMAVCKNPGRDSRITYYPVGEIAHHFWPESTLGSLIFIILARLFWGLKVIRHIVAHRADVILCQEPDCWCYAIVWKLFRRPVRVVMDMQEVYEERLLAFPKRAQPALRIAFRQISSWLSMRTDHIIHVSAERAELHSYLSAKCSLVRLFPQPRRVSQRSKMCERRDQNVEGRFVLLHLGALRPSYAAEELLQAVHLAARARPDVLLIVLGGADGATAHSPMLSACVKANIVRVVRRVSPAEIDPYLRCSDVGISLVLPIDLGHIYAQPRKLFEYMDAGLPVIGADVPTIRRVIADHACGLVVDPRRPEDIARAILDLAGYQERAARFGQNGKDAVLEHFVWHNEERKFLSIFDAFSRSDVARAASPLAQTKKASVAANHTQSIS